MDSMIESSKKSAVDGMEMFLRNFSFVPDERLDWRPTFTAKSALQVAAHAALYAGRFARMIGDRSLPIIEDESVWLAQVEKEEAAVTSRTQMEAIFRSGTHEVLAALDGLTAEDVALTLDSGQGWSMPMTFLMGLPGWHATLHTGQIDYLQTCWGDQKIYV
jgi:hypothetical protein